MYAHSASQSLKAVQTITKGISSGRFAPGEKLNEVALAEKLGISRNTLREGVAQLAGQGLVTRIPHRGVFIAEPTLDELKDLYRARAVLEPGALMWGAREGLEQLESIVATAEAERDAHDDVAQTNIALISDANQSFHRAIVASAGSAHLNDEMDRILAQMRLVFAHATDKNRTFHLEFVQQNRTVVNLIGQEKFADAAEYLARSLQATAENLQPYFG
ncbi:GntR family transcriptional regulator [Corynebacterium urogenitale]